MKHVLNRQAVPALRKMHQPKTALAQGIWYLSRYFKTEAETKKYLKEKQYSISDINFAVLKLKEYGYINDDRYCEVFTDINKQKYGAKFISQKLRLKGIKDDILLKYVGNLDAEDTSGTIKRLIEKFFKNKEKNNENKEKCLRSLMSKGFNFNNIKTELNYENWN